MRAIRRIIVVETGLRPVSTLHKSRPCFRLLSIFCQPLCYGKQSRPRKKL